jgi:DnaJ-class molecular chaperone
MECEVVKEAKIALCRKCHGTGEVSEVVPGKMPWQKRKTTAECPQCKGSGRVKVSGVMKLTIEPYEQQ